MTLFKNYKLIKKFVPSGSFPSNVAPLYTQAGDAKDIIAAVGGGAISTLSRDINIGFDFVFHNRKYTKFRAASSGYAQLVNNSRPPIVADPVVPTPTSYYSCDDDDYSSGTGIVHDRVGQNNATTSTVAASTASAKLFGEAFAFASATPSIMSSFSDDFSFTRTTKFSVSFWINTATASRNIMGNYGETMGWYISITAAGYIKIIFGDNGANEMSAYGATAVTDSNWHHVIVTYNGSSAGSGFTIYIDGSSESLTTAGTLATSIGNTTFVIGNRSTADPAAGKYLQATLDDIALWSGTMLSSTQVSYIYDKGINGGIPLCKNGPWAGRLTQSPSSYWPLVQPDTSKFCVDNGFTNNFKTVLDLRNVVNGTVKGVGTERSSNTPLGSSRVGIDGSFVLSGSAHGDYINFGNTHYGFKRDKAFSVSTWIRTEDTSAGLIGKYNIFGWILRIDGWGKASIKFTGDNDAYITKTTDAVVNNDAWHHVVAAYTPTSVEGGGNPVPSDLTLYLDGVLAVVATGSSGTIGHKQTTKNTTADLRLGVYTPTAGTNHYFKGNIIETAIWNKALSLAAVQNIYNQGANDVPLAINPRTEKNIRVLSDLGANIKLYQNNMLLPGPILAPWWNSTVVETTNLNIKTWLNTDGGVGRRKRIIQFPLLTWHTHNTTNGNLLFYQIALCENTNIIEYRYLPVKTYGVAPAIPNGASCGTAGLGKNQFRNFSVDDYKYGGSIDTETTNLFVTSGSYPGDELKNVYFFKPLVSTRRDYQSPHKTLQRLDVDRHLHPTQLRTGDMDRTRPINEMFDDRNTVIFNSTQVSYPTKLASNHPILKPAAASGINITASSSAGTSVNRQHVKLDNTYVSRYNKTICRG